MTNLTTVLLSVLITAVAFIIFFVVEKSSRKKKSRKLAHDIRSKLAVLKTNTELSLMEPNIDEKISRTLRSNIEEINKTSEMLNVLSK